MFLSKVKGEEEEVEQPIIYPDPPTLVAFLLDQHHLDPDMSEITFGLDDGQGVLKVMMILKDQPDGGAEPPCQWAHHSDGVSSSKTQKLSGVKKLIGKLVWECIETSSK